MKFEVFFLSFFTHIFGNKYNLLYLPNKKLCKKKKKKTINKTKKKNTRSINTPKVQFWAHLLKIAVVSFFFLLNTELYFNVFNEHTRK